MKDYDHNDPDYAPTDVECLIGQRIASAQIGKDKGGYDLLTLTLENGEVVQVHEQGQCGYFSLFHYVEPTNRRETMAPPSDAWYASDKATFHNRLSKLEEQIALATAAIERLATITHDTQQRMDGHTQWSAGKWEELTKGASIERRAHEALGVRVGRLERGEVATVATPKPPHQVQAEQDLAALRSQLGRMHTMLSDALQADGEQGSAWLSEAFAKRFRIEHPELCAWLENFTKWVTEELED